jgi:hypothetical protein
MRTLFLTCVLITGCIAEEAAPSDLGEPDDPAAPGAETSAREPIDVPAALQLQTEAGAPASADIYSCVYIQWCNKPNSPERITCVLRPRCIDTCNTQQGRDQVVSACQNDAVAVCGTKNNITYHGCNGLGPP